MKLLNVARWLDPVTNKDKIKDTSQCLWGTWIRKQNITVTLKRVEISYQYHAWWLYSPWFPSLQCQWWWHSHFRILQISQFRYDVAISMRPYSWDAEAQASSSYWSYTVNYCYDVVVTERERSKSRSESKTSTLLAVPRLFCIIVPIWCGLYGFVRVVVLQLLSLVRSVFGWFAFLLGATKLCSDVAYAQRRHGDVDAPLNHVRVSCYLQDTQYQPRYQAEHKVYHRVFPKIESRWWGSFFLNFDIALG